MRMVTWLMTMATAETIEYRTNLWIVRRPEPAAGPVDEPCCQHPPDQARSPEAFVQ